MLKSILFTHTDLDGAGCRIIFELIHMDKIKGKDYLIINSDNKSINDNVYNTLNEYKNNINKDTEICFADICAKNDCLLYLKENFKTIHIWDHHISNMVANEVIENATIIVENDMGIKQCGTSLLFQYYAGLNEKIKIFDKKYNQNLISEFVDTVRSYDTFEWKSTNNMQAKYLVTLYFLLNMESFCDKYVKILSDVNSKQLISDNDMQFIKSKLDFEQSVIDKLTPDHVYQLNLKGYKVAFLLGSRGANVSELSHQFLTKYPEFDVFISFRLNEQNSFSFRTIKNNINVAEIFAEPLGGGGHAAAAANFIGYDTVDELFKILFNKLKETEN